jgi:beta-glucosidase
VLLKNQNGALPLSREVRNVALIGPFAEDGGSLMGCWAARGRAADCISFADGLRSKLNSAAKLTVVQGCAASEGWKLVPQLDGTKVLERETNQADTSGIQKAVEAANAADVVLLALGEPAGWSGEDSARSDLGLPGRQNELFEAVVATGKPVIVILVNGRPLALPNVQDKAAAVLETWDPGVQGGNGVADILFGETEPAGRLTTSVPRSVGQVPIHYNHYNTGRPTMGKYVDGPREPLYPFGFGLTYTKFEYGKVELSATRVEQGKSLTARVSIKNTGPRVGSEVVQLYIRDVAASAGPRPVRELKGFQKVRLNSGETRDVSFTISEKELGYYDTKGQWLVEPGKFQVWLTRDAASGEPADFEMVK